MAMSGSRSILGASDEIMDIYCEPCHQAGQVAMAEGYCVDCPEYLCGQCFKMHRRNKIMANHVLLDKDSMPVAPDSRRNVLDVCEEKCPIHPSKVTEFFCETCDKLGCNVCVTLNHRQCEKVKHIPDIVKSQDLGQSDDLKTFRKNIKSKADHLSELEEKQKTNVTSNNELRKVAKQELNRQRAKLNTFFDELEKKMDNRITDIEERNRDNLKDASDGLYHIKHDLDQIQNDIEAKSTGQNCELFISIKRGKEKMMALDDQFDQIHQEQRIQRYTLLPSEQIEAMMRTTTEICSIATARLESEIDIRTTTDKKRPYICSLTIVHGHYCVVADMFNNSIKVIDTKSKYVTSEIGIEAEDIYSVTSVRNDQVVTSVELSGGRSQIQFFSVSASGVIQRNQLYNCENSHRDMVYYKGNIYGYSICGIEILSMTGKIIRTIQTGNPPTCIALCPDGQTIYVSDNYDHSVTSLTLDGKVKAVYKDKDLKEPRGITVDKHGYVYVSSCGTRNIQQLTADLNKVQVLIDDVYGIRITYSSTEHNLYISVCGQIHAYSLDVNRQLDKM